MSAPSDNRRRKEPSKDEEEVITIASPKRTKRTNAGKKRADSGFVVEPPKARGASKKLKASPPSVLSVLDVEAEPVAVPPPASDAILPFPLPSVTLASPPCWSPSSTAAAPSVPSGALVAAPSPAASSSPSVASFCPSPAASSAPSAPSSSPAAAPSAKTRGVGFISREVDVLLDLYEAMSPIGGDMWNRLAVRFNEMKLAGRPERNADSLRKKFQKLANVKKPTGDPSLHPQAKRAKQLYHKVTGEVAAGSLGLSNEFNEDSDDDEEVDEAPSSSSSSASASRSGEAGASSASASASSSASGASASASASASSGGTATKSSSSKATKRSTSGSVRRFNQSPRSSPLIEVITSISREMAAANTQFLQVMTVLANPPAPQPAPSATLTSMQRQLEALTAFVRHFMPIALPQADASLLPPPGGAPGGASASRPSDGGDGGHAST